LQYMRHLEYLLCKTFSVPLDDHWTDLSAGPHFLIGRYRYRAIWPGMAGQPEEANFEVTSKGTIPFKAPKP